MTQRSLHTLVALLTVALPGAVAGAAEPAAEGDVIALLPVLVEGELPASFRTELHARLHEGMARGQRPVVAVSDPTSCSDAACLREIGREHAARFIARAKVRVEDRDFAIALELFDARSGTSVTKSEGTCEVCAVAEVGDMLADYAGLIDRKLDALDHAPPVIRFDSRPAGALVFVDGQLVGTAPLERSVDEGRHRARAELDDHLPLEVQFDAVAGTRDEIRLVLSPIPRPHRPLKPWGWALVGTGVGLGGVGVPLLVLHGRPYRGRCSGDDVDIDGDCRFRYGTRTGGIVVLATAGAAIVAGATLLGIAARRDRRDREAMRVRPTVDGVALRF